MRSALLDKLTVMALAAALTLWACCLAVLWGWATDTSGRSAIVTVAALLLAMAVAMYVPGHLLRGAQRLIASLRRGGAW